MSFKELPIMSDKNKGTLLFYPYISKKSKKNVSKVLSGRWIGQGPMVDKFEKKFEEVISKKHCAIATGSGTDSLHLAYILAGLKEGDEVITTVFTCTATNIPLLYMGIKIKFADIDISTMNISIESKKPVGNCILTCFNYKQAISRKNKGEEAAFALNSILYK